MLGYHEDITGNSWESSDVPILANMTNNNPMTCQGHSKFSKSESCILGSHWDIISKC